MVSPSGGRDTQVLVFFELLDTLTSADDAIIQTAYPIGVVIVWWSVKCRF